MNSDECKKILCGFNCTDVYRMTGWAEHWITTYTMGVWGFDEGNRRKWDKLNPGDIGVFHATKASKNFSGSFSGIIGFGRVKDSCVKTDKWWYAEHLEDSNIWKYVVSFDKMYFLGGVEEIDLDTPINEKSRALIENEIRCLFENRITIEDILRATNLEFPTRGSMSEFKPEIREYLVDRFSESDLKERIQK